MSNLNNTEDTENANEGWIKTHILNKLTYERTLLIIAGSVSVVFAAISVFFWTKHLNDEFWSNYWNGTPIIITIIAALSSFYIQNRINKKFNNHEDYFKYQDEIDKTIMPKFTKFSFFRNNMSELDKNSNSIENNNDKKSIIELSLEEERQLTEDLSDILLAIRISDNKRGDLVVTPQDGNNKGREVIDYSDYFGNELQDIYDTHQFDRVFDTVQNSHHYFGKVISDLGFGNQSGKVKELSLNGENQIVDEAKDGELIPTEGSQEGFENTPINSIDDRILKAWILKQSYAEKAKYLVGVATSDKRVVGVYDLRNEHIAVQKDNNNRVDFNVKDYHNRIYLEGVKGSESPALPGLDNWTAMNPVLYYINYLKATDQYETMSPENKKTVLSMLKGEEVPNDKVEDEWKDLSGRDVIVVRTYKFGKKDEQKLADKAAE